jgi:hypothetical protein
VMMYNDVKRDLVFLDHRRCIWRIM